MKFAIIALICSTIAAEQLQNIAAEKILETIETMDQGEYMGCFKDAAERDLPELLGARMHPVDCLRKAMDQGFSYVGLQFGGQCWAGHSYGKYSGARPESECSRACLKDPTVKCGAGWRNSVYRLPNNQPPAAPESELEAEFESIIDPVQGCCQLSRTNNKCAYYEYENGDCRGETECTRAFWDENAVFDQDSGRCVAPNAPEPLAYGGCCQRTERDDRCAWWDYAGGTCVPLSTKRIGCNRAVWHDHKAYDPSSGRCVEKPVKNLVEILEGTQDLSGDVLSISTLSTTDANAAQAPEGCLVWFNGCNNCLVMNRLLACKRDQCSEEERREPTCVEFFKDNWN